MEENSGTDNRNLRSDPGLHLKCWGIDTPKLHKLEEPGAMLAEDWPTQRSPNFTSPSCGVLSMRRLVVVNLPWGIRPTGLSPQRRK